MAQEKPEVPQAFKDLMEEDEENLGRKVDELGTESSGPNSTNFWSGRRDIAQAEARTNEPKDLGIFIDFYDVNGGLTSIVYERKYLSEVDSVRPKGKIKRRKIIENVADLYGMVNDFEDELNRRNIPFNIDNQGFAGPNKTGMMFKYSHDSYSNSLRDKISEVIDFLKITYSSHLE